jgi:chaperonin GroES
MIRPINDYVVIDRPRSDDVTKGGVLLPTQSGRRKPTEGIVVAVGPGRKNKRTGQREAMQCKPGDRVWFRQYDVEKAKGVAEAADASGKPYVFIRDEDIVAVIESNYDEFQKSYEDE